MAGVARERGFDCGGVSRRLWWRRRGQGEGDALSRIAQVGLGQQLTSPRSAADLFDLIQRELTTLQSRGAVMALPPGVYDFQLVIGKRGNRRARGEIRFRFEVRSDAAHFVSF